MTTDEKRIITLNDLIEAAGGDQGDSVLEVYDEAWNLYRVEHVEPETIDEDDLEALTGQPVDEDDEGRDWTPSVHVRLVLVKRNRPY